MSQFLAQTAWFIPIYPLIGMLLSILWFPSIIHKTGPRPAGYVNAIMTFFALAHGTLALPALLGHEPIYLSFEWLDVAGLSLSFPIEISVLTVGAMSLVTVLNLLAQIFSIGYMEMDWGWARFYSMLALFEAGMCALLLSNSLFVAYMILEILTLATYLLIGLWFNQSLVVTGARDAFLTKRIGDLFLLMGVLAIYPLAGTWDFRELAVWAETANVDPTVAALVGLALIAGPMGKCAQFPLHLWLDEAMEGPIPASILRNSVVVATGAWVLVKLEPVLALSPFALNACIFIGAVTALGGSLIAIAQIDAKRTLSYPVSVYMGLVFIAVGAQQPQAALLITLSHAVAMALLVMCIGCVIWNCITQDVTQLGGLWARRPITGIAFLVGTAGLVALPPLGGFWALLDLGDELRSTRPVLLGLLLLINALSAFGLMRVFGLIWGNKPKPMTARSPEVFWPMTLPTVIMVGFVLHLPLILQSLDLLPDWASMSKDVALMFIWSSIFGLSLGGVFYLGPSIQKPVRLPSKALQDLLAYDFYTPKLYRSTIVLFVGLLSAITSVFDRFFVDGIVNLFGTVTVFGGQSLKYSNSGQTQFYVLTILLGLMFIGLVVSWPLISHLSLVAN
jgi:NAD(P)H-quinone oxidoreductase subunit 5